MNALRLALLFLILCVSFSCTQSPDIPPPLDQLRFVERVPVFEGFMTNKHRITPEGSAWLAAR